MSRWIEGSAGAGRPTTRSVTFLASFPTSAASCTNGPPVLLPAVLLPKQIQTKVKLIWYTSSLSPSKMPSATRSRDVIMAPRIRNSRVTATQRVQVITLRTHALWSDTKISRELSIPRSTVRNIIQTLNPTVKERLNHTPQSSPLSTPHEHIETSHDDARPLSGGLNTEENSYEAIMVCDDTCRLPKQEVQVVDSSQSLSREAVVEHQTNPTESFNRPIRGPEY